MRIWLVIATILLVGISPAHAQVNEECFGIDLTTFKGVVERVACAGAIDSPNATGETDSIITIVGNVLSIAYSVLGIVFVTLLVFAGYLWLTARGNEDQVTRAQTLIRNSVIGIIIIFIAFIISREIVTLLKETVDATR